ACWNAATGERLWTASFSADSVAYDSDGKNVFLGTDDGKVHQLEVATGRERRTWTLRGAIWAIAISPDGGRLVAAGDGGAFLLDTIAGQVTELERPQATISSAAFSPDGSRFALTGPPIVVYDAATAQPLVELPLP